MVLQNQTQIWCLVYFIIKLMGSGVEGLSASNALTHFSFTFPAMSDQQKGRWNSPPVGIFTKEIMPVDHINSGITVKQRNRRQTNTRSKTLNESPGSSTRPKVRQNVPQKSLLSSDFSRRLRNFRRLLPILRAFDRRRQMLSGRLRKKPKLATKRDGVKQQNRKGNAIPKSMGSRRSRTSNTDRTIVSRVLRIQE